MTCFAPDREVDSVNETEESRCGSVQAIRCAIRAEEQRLLNSYPLLAFQDALGFTCFFCSLVAMGGMAALYLHDAIPWWLTIPVMALPLSILHELEHDLIHNLYFKRRSWIQNSMFFVIWIAKLSLNPWYRRTLHLKHHQVSGQETDIEERLIGLGLPCGPLRLLVTIHPMGGLLLFPRIKREVPEFQPWRLVLLSVPTYLLFLITWESFAGYSRLRTGWTVPLDPAHLLPDSGWPWARDLSILLVLPNMLRQACLVFMSSHSHYYGDIPERDVFFQNQILNTWMFLPFQIFCFNFGATHIIHHYVVNQPFYLRQMVAGAAQSEMRRQGIRLNDMGTFWRDNRWGFTPEIDQISASQ